MEPIKDLKSYVPTDDFFGAPYIDEDVELDTPVPHRMIHGGFEGTDTRFRFHFPSEGYQGRMYNPLSGANGGTEDFFASPMGEAIGGLSSCVRLGGYMVQSNQGHIGDELDPNSITSSHFADLADDFSLNARAFEHTRRDLGERVAIQAKLLREEALQEGWHDPCIERILEVIAARLPRAT